MQKEVITMEEYVTLGVRIREDETENIQELAAKENEKAEKSTGTGWHSFITDFVCVVYPVIIMLLFIARIVNLIMASKMGEPALIVTLASLTAAGSLAAGIMFIFARKELISFSDKAFKMLYTAWGLGIAFNGIIPVLEHEYVFHSCSIFNIIGIIASAALLIWTIVYYSRNKDVFSR